MEPQALLEGLNDAQRDAVTSDAAPLCILAGAGSGKTRVLTRRIAHRAATGSLDPRHCLAITFTRKAGGELAHRLRALGLSDSIAAGTFHSVAYAQLRTRWADNAITPPTLLERKVGFVTRILPRRGSDPVDLATALDVVTEIEWAKARMLGPADYAAAATEAQRRVSLDVSVVADVFDRYEKEKRTRRMVDFDDLLRLCRRDLVDDRTFRAAQHWRFRHVFVDEFQDLNPLQYSLLEAWLGERTDLCIVGDPNQAIYSFNGAEAALLTDFARDHPGTEVIRLDRNYRSTPQVLAVANSILSSGLRTSTGRGTHATSTSLVATLPDGPLPTVSSHASDTAEARAIARAVRASHRPGTSWADQAVLVRTNAQASTIATALDEAEIPNRIRGGGLPADRSQMKAEVHPAADGVDPTGSDDAVAVSTFHAAKGLEWPIVHVAGIEFGLVPIGHARTAEALAEERRLFFVAITRAAHELHLTWARERTFGTRTSQRDPSPFLDEVEAAIAVMESGNGASAGHEVPAAATGGTGRGGRGRAGRPRRHGATNPLRPSASRLDPAAKEVLEALKAWRSTKARAAAVPAYVIFHDSTLEAVATASPRTHDDLLTLPGLGPIKVGRYGDDLLRVVAAHAAG